MAMPRLADLVNKMNFQGRLATSAIQIASFPEFLPVPSQESHLVLLTSEALRFPGNDSNLLIVFYVQIMPDDFVMQLHRF